MRLGTVEPLGALPSAVVFGNDGPVALPFGDVRELLEAGSDGLDAAAEALAVGRPFEREWRLLRPIREPAGVFCVGLNYGDYLKRTEREPGPAPVWFDKLSRSLADPDAEVPLSPLDPGVDYEGELAVVIGTEARRLDSADAWAVVAGFTLFNDVTARGLVKQRGQIFFGKNLERSSALGPIVVTPEEAGDFADLRFELRVNGELRQRGAADDLVFDVADLIADLTSLTTLYPGDVIATGTPWGMGMNYEPPRWLGDGDLVEVTCPAIGTLGSRFITSERSTQRRRTPMPTDQPATFVSPTELETAPQRPSWPALKVPSETIDAQFKELESGELSDWGRRERLVVHPFATAPGLGFAPGIDVSIGTLLPGESTLPRRQNTVSVTMALSGNGKVDAADQSFEVEHRDLWALPSMRTESLTNTGDGPLRYITYSDGPVLRNLHTHFVEIDPQTKDVRGDASELTKKIRRAKEDAPPFEITPEGAWLQPYEHLVDPEVTDSRPILWPWEELSKHLGLVEGLGPEYTGRPLLALYNPASKDKNGATQTFFAAFGAAQAGFATHNHRHMSAAINYHIRGAGYSIVDGERIDWDAGDLLLSAPAWSEHAHHMGDDGTWTLTIQDHPFHIGVESLVWQEEIDGPILTLGTETGFQTNIAEIRG